MYRRVAAITGMPRSGTSWLGMIVDSSPQVRYRLSPLFSYEFKNYLDELSEAEDWEHVLRGAYNSSDDFMTQTERRRSGEYPVWPDKQREPEVLVLKFTRFHNLLERMLELVSDLKVVAVVRHPCGAIHSWLTTPSEFPADADPLAEWRTGACRKPGFGEFWGFDDWKTVTRLHMRLAAEHPTRFGLVRYEEAVADPQGCTRELFERLDLEFTAQTERFVQQSHASHNQAEHAVFKDPSVKDRWRAELQPAIRDEIEAELRGTDLEQFMG